MARACISALVSTALAVLLLLALSDDAPREARVGHDKPNFVFVLADDMRKDDLRHMPRTRSLLQDEGTSFANAFVSNPLCCPSRATIMRGQYAHNTGVWSNVESSPAGGWQAYRENGLEKDNVATRLDDAGYRTALIGKYFNGYNRGVNYVPPGWDRWFAAPGFHYYDYSVNDDGTIRHFGGSDNDYHTDVLRRQARAFVGSSAAQGKPFFAYVSAIAPHEPATPAPRHLHTYDGEQTARTPSFQEENVSDKPPRMRSRPLLNREQIANVDRRHERRAETLQALDELVAGVVGKLRAEGVLGNTYVLFTSDNGWSEGEHRRASGKANPYEEDIHMPLLVRGPGVAAGSTTRELTLNTDFLPTFTDLAGVQTPGYVDGRSLRPLLEGSVTSWRSAILLEGREGPWTHAASSYHGIRTSAGKKYVAYENGFRELYYLNADPYELTNRYDVFTPPTNLATRLKALKGCAGDGCRTAEDGRSDGK
jgi:N-acetylglucosamine-6-sulfatase